MIYTITLNPSIDYSMHPKSLRAGEINKSEFEKVTFGGKGINVSAVLAALGRESVALGFVGGYTGREIERLCRRAGVVCDFCEIQDSSRINVKVQADTETAINGKGPLIRFDEEEALLKKLSELSAEDTAIISGSAPESESGRLLENVIEAVSHTRFIADMDGASLALAVSKRPYLIKPNLEEFCSLCGRHNMTIEEIAAEGSRLRREGVKNVLVSLGGDGALLASCDGNIYRASAPACDVISTVGAGDSLLAGFLAGEDGSPSLALALGVAAGSATAARTGLASGEEIMSFFAGM